MLFVPIVCMAQTEKFDIEEITNKQLHTAIQNGETTCVQTVQSYIDRARAYNGACTVLVTPDGNPVEQAFGNIRAGVPNAGQLNALEMLNSRGERSVSCKLECDTHPSKGGLLASCTSECDAFRKQPDALELAADLDVRFGTKPPLDSMALVLCKFLYKNWYDTTEMRATGGNDVDFAMDAPKVDSPDIRKQKEAGAIMFGVATAARTGLSFADRPDDMERAWLRC